MKIYETLLFNRQHNRKLPDFSENDNNNKVSTDDKKGENHGYFFYRKTIEIL